MELILSVNGKEIPNGDYAVLQSIAREIEDRQQYSDIINELCKSESRAVRNILARSEFLTGETVKLLLEDSSYEVVVGVLHNYHISHLITKEDVEKIIDKNVFELIEALYYCFDFYNNDVQTFICEKLYKYPDPEIRCDIAGNRSTPVNFLHELLKDSQPKVADVARKTLEMLIE